MAAAGELMEYPSKLHETRSRAKHPSSSGEEEEKKNTRKQKAEHSKTSEEEHDLKKSKHGKSVMAAASEEEHDLKKSKHGKSVIDAAMEFDKFCKATREHLSIKMMREILESNGQDSSVADDAVVPRCQDMLFYGALEDCSICGGKIQYNQRETFTCNGNHSEWCSCIYTSKDPPRKKKPIKLPNFIKNIPTVCNLIKSRQQVPKYMLKRECLTDKPFDGMSISLSDRLSRKHGYWKSKIESYGGMLSNSIIGATCLVLSPAERGRGGDGSSRVAKALEQGIPIVREEWLHDSIEKLEAQPFDIHDIVSDLSVKGKGIPVDQKGIDKEVLVAEVKIYGKRGVHKDSKLQERGGVILEKDGILYNCVLAVTDLAPRVNDFCVMQLIMVPNEGLHMYFKKGRIGGDDAREEERVKQWENVESAIEEFVRLFEELTGNEFEPWEREKKFEKKNYKLYPTDMADGMDVRHGGLGLQQLEVAVAHSKLDPIAANFMKILCSQEIYRYAIMELGLDLPDLPVGMLSDFHLKRCEGLLVDFPQILESTEKTCQKAIAWWGDISCRWFSLLPSSRPMLLRDFHDLADHAASTLETVRDITMASHFIGDMTEPTLDDPLFDRYKKLGCSVSTLDKVSDDYKMIVKYLETTYEPFIVGDVNYGVSIKNILAVDPTACPSYDEIKNLPNKYLLWCGTKSSNLLRHLHKGFLPSICWLPQPGYMFGRSIVCYDTSAAAARYGFTSVDRPDGFLVLAIASLGDQITEYNRTPEMEEAVALQVKKMGVVGLGRKKTDESEHFIWKDDIKVPCGHLVPSEHEESPLEYNEFATYGSKVRICFIVEVKYEEV
ncbi:protein ADP-ribosyltransferase PARP3-like [Impatiens glandulifera]|uniref:protein ADP-ribosyltransferase PARP3-like n=1 Tax=Impatiens glandulifera TaxID=253017 RepID=UPI001FB1159F|nr:protein ADP-ribosyltransferase PARP3-like [Impatiens glandulifera]